MAVRRSGPEHDPAELARRRLSQLGAELAPPAGQPSTAGQRLETVPEPAQTHPAHPADPAHPAADDLAAPSAQSGRHAGARASRPGRLVGRAVDSLPLT